MTILRLEDTRPSIPYKSDDNFVFLRHLMAATNTYGEDYFDMRQLTQAKSVLPVIDHIRIDIINTAAKAGRIYAQISHKNLSAITDDSRVIVYFESYNYLDTNSLPLHNTGTVFEADYFRYGGLRYPFDKIYFGTKHETAAGTGNVLFNLQLRLIPIKSLERACEAATVEGVRN